MIFGKSAPLQQVAQTFSYLLANGYIQYVILMLIWQEHGIFMDQNKREPSSLLIGWRTRGPPGFLKLFFSEEPDTGGSPYMVSTLSMSEE